ncbi:cGMP-dependent protein kinase [Durusdinium trenchii]|uniref:cGMP-dependent protein kinase n=1 Tax=Durusdinium trenchii TaxID=1381693 RepID=A0ABP0H5A9_9DINO
MLRPAPLAALGSRQGLQRPFRRATAAKADGVGPKALNPHPGASWRLATVGLAKQAGRSSSSRVRLAFFGRPLELQEEETEVPLNPQCVRLWNGFETQLEVLAFPKDTMPYILGGDRHLLQPQSHLDLAVGRRSSMCRIALRRRDAAQMLLVPKGNKVKVEAFDEESQEGLGPLEVRVGDLHVSFEDGSSFEIFPGPLFWRLSRNVEDVEFQEASILQSADARVCFKVVRQMGSDWRGHPLARVRVISAGFLGTKYLHKGTMYLAKIVPIQAKEEIINAFKRITGTFGQPEQILHFEGYVKTESGAHMLLFEDFGESLSKIMSSSSETLTAEDNDQCAEDLLRAITALHQQGIYHLALSPESVRLRRDGMGRMRLKLSDLGAFERPSEPIASRAATQLGWRSYTSPEIRRRKTLLDVAKRARKPKKKAPKVQDSKILGNLKTLEILPSLRRSQVKQNFSKSAVSRETRRELLAEFAMFAELDQSDLTHLAREFQGPFYVPPGASLFNVGETGDFLYFLLAGEVVARRGKRELRRYRRGGFLGEAALFGAKPTRRIFSASVARGGQGCALLRMHHTFFRRDLKNRGPVTSVVGPTRWRYLEQPNLELQPEEVDVFAAGAVWCQLAAGSKVVSFFRIKRATTIEDLLDAVATSDIGSFYFLVQEWRGVALIELMVRRASAYEALVCLEEKEKLDVVKSDETETQQGLLGSISHTVSDLQKAAGSAFELTQDAVSASVAVRMSNNARQTLLQQWEKLSNKATERYGQAIGEIFGDIYGNLFAKDMLWIFRNPTRAQRFPVLLVRDAEDGSLLARWQIGASMVFESELCARTLPRVLPSVRPALAAGFQIGSAVGRNRAINFKRLWIDAFLGSFVKQLWTLTRMRAKRLVRRRVKWDAFGSALKESVIQGQTARNLVLTKFGRLPTKYDQNDPQVLRLLPSKWVPEIGLPLASGVGRGFMTKWWKGFRSGLRRRYVRPRFETWDLEDVPQVILDFARQQGAEQANLVASSVGDTMARDWGYWTGHSIGVVSGLILCMVGGSKSLKDDRGMVIADGHLEEDRELLALQQYMGDSKYKGT